MDTGKIASQAGHAYIGSFLQTSIDIQQEYHQDFPQSPGTKICLNCPSLEHLLKAEELAKEAGLPFFRVIDSGCPNFFNGEPTITALGIGPARRDQVKHITRKLKLL
jgi:peptidyl-tRNA hydrolase